MLAKSRDQNSTYTFLMSNLSSALPLTPSSLKPTKHLRKASPTSITQLGDSPPRTRRQHKSNRKQLLPSLPTLANWIRCLSININHLNHSPDNHLHFQRSTNVSDSLGFNRSHDARNPSPTTLRKTKAVFNQLKASPIPIPKRIDAHRLPFFPINSTNQAIITKSPAIKQKSTTANSNALNAMCSPFFPAAYSAAHISNRNTTKASTCPISPANTATIVVVDALRSSSPISASTTIADINAMYSSHIVIPTPIVIPTRPSSPIVTSTANTTTIDGVVTNTGSTPSFRLQLISSNNTPVNIYSAPTTEAYVIDTIMPWGYICLHSFPTHLHEHYMLANGGYIVTSLAQGQRWLFDDHPGPTSPHLHPHYLQLAYPSHCDSSTVLKWWIANLDQIIHNIYFEGWQYHPLDIEYWLGLRGIHDCIIVEDYEDRGRPRITFLQTAIADSITNSTDPQTLGPAYICIANAFLTEIASQYMEICMCRQFHEPLDTCIVHNETRCLPFSHPHHLQDPSKNEESQSDISDEADISANNGMSMTEALHYLHSSDDDDVAKRTASLRRATIARLESVRGKMPPRTTTTVYFDNPHDLSRIYLEDALHHLNDLDDQGSDFSDSSSDYCPSFDGEEGFQWDPWNGLQCAADHHNAFMAVPSTQPQTLPDRHATPAQLVHARMISCKLHSRLQQCHTSVGTHWPFIDHSNLEPRHDKYSPHRRPSPRRPLLLTIPPKTVSRTFPFPIPNQPSPSYIRATNTVNAFLRHLPLPCKNPVNPLNRRRLSTTKHSLCPLSTTEFTLAPRTSPHPLNKQAHNNATIIGHTRGLHPLLPSATDRSSKSAKRMLYPYSRT